MKNVLLAMTVFLTIDVITANVGLKTAIQLRTVNVWLCKAWTIWYAVTDNVNTTGTSGKLHVNQMTTVLVMLSSVTKDTVGVLTV